MYFSKGRGFKFSEQRSNFINGGGGDLKLCIQIYRKKLNSEIQRIIPWTYEGITA